jgi:GTP cyclohydrolase I
VENNELDFKSAENSIKKLFECLKINLPDETPKRYVKMMYDMTRYQNVSNQEIADLVNKTFEIDTKTDSSNMVLVKDIEVFSLCEHHIALIYDMKISVGYIPNKFVLGLSKIVRLADMVCKRLQLQEKIAEDILDIMKILTRSSNIAVHIKAKHSCVTARGIRNTSSETVTLNFNGKFLKDDFLKSSFLSSLS